MKEKPKIRHPFSLVLLLFAPLSVLAAPFDVILSNNHPARIERDGAGGFWVTDPSVQSAFRYDAALELRAEIRNLARPLGIAVSGNGLVYVGSDQRNHIAIYRLDDGGLAGFLGEGVVRKPNDLTFDLEGKLYVADSERDQILVYKQNGSFLRTIGASGSGPGELKFPVAVALAYHPEAEGGWSGELFVMDQGNFRIQVFALDGTFLRSFGASADSSINAFTSSTATGSDGSWQGKFVKGQDLIVDDQHRVHALDSYLRRVQILEGDNGAFVGSYGMPLDLGGELKLPLGLIMDDSGRSVVADYDLGALWTTNSAPQPVVMLSSDVIPEDTPVGAVVGTLTVSPAPASGGTEYRLLPGAGDLHNAAFVIEGNQLKTTATLDHETLANLQVRIKAIQAGASNLIYASALQLTVSNVNESVYGLQLEPAEVMEAYPIGTDVGTLLPLDPDLEDQHSFALVSGTGDDDNALFQVVSNRLLTAAVLDYETQSNLTVRVRVTDGGGSSYSVALAVEVVNLIETTGEPDRDNDGIADWYERTHTGSTVAMRPGDDPDLDGVNNLEEWLANTNPGNASDWLRIENWAMTSEGRPLLQWFGQSERQYDVIWIPDDINAPWELIAADLPSESVTEFVHPGDMPNTIGFYLIRAKLVP